MMMIDYAVWGSAIIQVLIQVMVYHCGSLYKSYEVQLPMRGNKCHKRFLAEVSVIYGVAVKI